MSDSVRQYLREKGCADHVVKGGLDWLVGAWEKTVEATACGYELGLDDYLNDLDARQLILEVLDNHEVEPTYVHRVHRADERMKKLVRQNAECLWGDEAARRHGWSADRNWWYFSVPKTAGPELLIDLNSDRL